MRVTPKLLSSPEMKTEEQNRMTPVELCAKKASAEENRSSKALPPLFAKSEGNKDVHSLASYNSILVNHNLLL